MTIQVLAQEALETGVLFVNRIRHTHKRPAGPPDIVDRLWCGGVDVRSRLVDKIRHDGIDHTANDLVDQAPVVEIRITFVHFVVLVAEQGLPAQLLEADQARAETIIDVVIVVRDRIDNIGDLRLKSGLFTIQKAFSNKGLSVSLTDLCWSAGSYSDAAHSISP